MIINDYFNLEIICNIRITLSFNLHFWHWKHWIKINVNVGADPLMWNDNISPYVQDDFLYLSRVKLIISPQLLNQIDWNFNQWCVMLDTDLYTNFIKICWKLFILLTIEFLVIFLKSPNLTQNINNFRTLQIEILQFLPK